MSQKLTKAREKCVRESPEEGARKRRNKSDQQTKSHFSEKNHQYWGDYVVRELSTGRRIFMKPSESERSKGLVCIITKRFSPHWTGLGIEILKPVTR